MTKMVSILSTTSLVLLGLPLELKATDTLAEAFKNGKINGSIKSYYYVQQFKGAGKNDSSIWANGGSLGFVTDSLNGLTLGATFQTSHIAHIDDIDNKTQTTMDAQGSVLSESYLQYQIKNTMFKGGRQFVSTPLVAGSGSRLIKESFEAYLLTNTDIPKTTIVVGKITKYQLRTDYTSSATFNISADANPSGDVAKFKKVGNNGVDTIYIKNSSLPNLTTKFQYAYAKQIANLIYVAGEYKISSDLKPFVAAQFYNTEYKDGTSKDNTLYGVKTGLSVSGLDLFASYASVAGQEGDAAVISGLGIAAFKVYTKTTKNAGGHYNAGTNSWQVGAGYKFGDFKTKIRYTSIDSPIANNDLEDTTLNLEYAFGGKFKNLKVKVDYSNLDFENNTRDAKDIRSKLIYSF